MAINVFIYMHTNGSDIITTLYKNKIFRKLLIKEFFMFLDVEECENFSVYAQRREELVKRIRQECRGTKGLIILFGNLAKENIFFRQESSFYYFSGISEPGGVLVINMLGQSTLYIPSSYKNRAKYDSELLYPDVKTAKKLHLDKIEVIGKESENAVEPVFARSEYEYLLSRLEPDIKNNGKLFVLNPNNLSSCIEQKYALELVRSFLSIKDNSILDISSVVADMRRVKNLYEIEKMSEAINCTIMAFEASVQEIKDGAFERDVQASIEYIFVASGAKAAYPSIVGGGKNGSILHYTSNNDKLKHGDLVLIDIGAEYKHYCADLTRTFPVSGIFSERQKELYKIILDTQKYIASVVKPGYWLTNNNEEEKSLTHLAKKFLKERGGYDQYFCHGIGHFLGLDVHDAGDYKKPLQEGDVITIEPGLYINEECISIRLEDNYWITKNQAICLSEMLPKEIDEVERFMKEGIIEVEENDLDHELDITNA